MDKLQPVGEAVSGGPIPPYDTNYSQSPKGIYSDSPEGIYFPHAWEGGGEC